MVGVFSLMMGMLADERWEVVVDKLDENGETVQGQQLTIMCSFLAIASGHHAKPSRPTFLGEKSFPGVCVCVCMCV